MYGDAQVWVGVGVLVKVGCPPSTSTNVTSVITRVEGVSAEVPGQFVFQVKNSH